MNALIVKKLNGLSERHDITILYACESGSRAWGFPSSDSDYDVRFIYAHKPDWYLSLQEGKDTINLPIDENELDITGWELKKTLKLLQKSNVSPQEWIESPIVYHQDDGFVTPFRDLCQAFFSPKSVIHHYQTICKKYYESVKESEEPKLKSYFYSLRTALIGMWIREMDTMPPIVFEEMLTLVETPVKERIIELMEIKSQENETYLHGQEPVINNFLKQAIKENGRYANDLRVGKGDVSIMNAFFLKTVKNHAS